MSRYLLPIAVAGATLTAAMAFGQPATDWSNDATANPVSPQRSSYCLASFPGGPIVTGGNNSLTITDTWQWDGSNWAEIVTATNPARRLGHAMAYDSARNRIVMFGGSWFPTQYAETWEFDGTNWTLLSPLVSPPARSFHSMAYDVARGRTVLFGGTVNGGSLDDTWEWDGTNWTQRNPAAKPSPRYSAGMAYDEARQRTVLYGGFPNSAQTWEWDGTNWALQSPVASPPGEHYHALAYDRARERVVMYGGDDFFNDRDVWEYDGATWVMANPTQRPSFGTLGPYLAYDFDRRQVVYMHGGSGGTWTYAPNDPASYTLYGSGCAGSNGVPLLEPVGFGDLPWIDDSFDVRVSNLPSGTAELVFLVIGFSQTATDLTGAGAPGCFALSSAETTVALVVKQPSETAITFQQPIPNTPALNGVSFFHQAATTDPSTNALGIVFSNGGELTVGQR